MHSDYLIDEIQESIAWLDQYKFVFQLGTTHEWVVKSV